MTSWPAARRMRARASRVSALSSATRTRAMSIPPSTTRGGNDQARDLRLKIVEPDRLLEEAIGSRVENLLARVVDRMAGDGQDLDLPCRRVRLHPATHLESVEARHADVEDQQVRIEAADLDQSLVPVLL